ncbi:enoyl-CoA hydratase/isomerase family protein [Aerophototrophica crusticola]|uniref:Enoyl-CoA hydratase/isomerase family protein n=1 Tax=Aerophototrophica crusticola TaxID=1709002 RepID=A0A858R767_9PROT|nr:enoyl-CoA hydratase/isomerase family protein [Rhodospirillaceae bacterium B3]
MGYETILAERTGWTLHVTLHRLESRNAMNGAMVGELSAVFAEAAADDTLRAVVLRGAGGTFCAGGDLRDMGGGLGDDPAAGLAKVNRAFGALLEQAEALPQVLVAVVEGGAMGGGFGLVAVSDIAIASDTASFGLPEVKLGLVPAQIAPFVARRIGLPATRRLALTGGKLDGSQALALGLVHQIVPAGGLDAALTATLDQIRACAPKAVAATKRLLNRVGQEPTGALLDEAASLFAQAALGREAMKGIPAFLSKQPAPWAKGDA